MAENKLPENELPDQEPIIITIGELHDLTIRGDPELNAVTLEIVNVEGVGFMVTIDAGVVTDVIVGLINAQAKLSGYSEAVEGK